MTSDIRGIRREQVDAWLAGNVPDAEPPFDYALIAGGRSNLTYAVRDARGTLRVLRRPPLGHVLQSAHDMGREHRIISALHATAVPVPQPLALCDDPEVTGAPFYVMSHVEGVVLVTRGDAERRLPLEHRQRAAFDLIDVLADIHAVAPTEVGLGDLGRTEQYVERQLRRWRRQLQAAESDTVPVLHAVHDRLAAQIPAQLRDGIVHGDYRLGNCLIGPDGPVRAVLDWELCTLGDPMADLGWVMAWWIHADERADHLDGRAPSMAEGFPTREALTRRYAERAGAEVGDLDFFVALAYWKLACISEGVYARYRAGAMADGTPEQIARLREHVRRLADAATRWSEQL